MFAAFHGINGRILLIPLVALIAQAGVGFVSVEMFDSITQSERAARTRVITEAATKIVEHFEAKAAKGEMPEAAAQDAAKDVLRAIRFDGNEYVTVHDMKGITLAHGMNPAFEGKASIDSRDVNGTYYARNQVRSAAAGGGFDEYVYPKALNTPPVRKVTYSKASTGGWNWAVSSGLYLDEVDAAARKNAISTITAIGALAVLTFAIAWWLGRRIARPVLRLSVMTHQIAEGDLSGDVPGLDRRDEIGTMAQAINVLKAKSAEAADLRDAQDRLKDVAEQERLASMRQLADGFEVSVKRVVDGMAASAGEMESSANAMTEAAAQADGKTSSAAAAAEQTSANVQTVAAATEELASSTQEISRQVTNSAAIATGAVTDAERTNTAMAQLAESAKRVGDIVSLISGIASQTNLLSLNATIEAARAGDAGKGFAVVASEVKSLATQTGKATEEIQAKVAEIQAMTGSAVAAIQGIGKTVVQMNEITSAVLVAVEQQGSAIGEITRNVHQAASGTQQVSVNVSDAQRAVSETSGVAAGVLGAAGSLSRDAEGLRTEVERFLAQVRAA
ncbi:MAG: methyl-accepting chemotaxis protein [Acetobacteraceae bacterium]|nr:methyl-accepting chemotaxis protein [Acetobacteraceae bacterium]